MINWRKVGMTSSHHGPYDQGYHVLQWRIQREATSREQADLIKCVVVRIGSPQLDSMKSESLVIVDQNATVNTFPALYTPPVTPWEWVAKK